MAEAPIFSLLLFNLLAVIPLWRLLPRAGLAAPWALAAFIPFGLLILLWVMAFRRWPGDPASEAA